VEEFDMALSSEEREAIDALAAMEEGNTTWWDLGEHMTCAEAEAVARFFAVFGHDEVAADVLDGHAEADEEGDAHWLAPASA